MSVRYKFKNDLNYSTLNIDGFHISVRDLKRAIVEAKKLGRVTDYDLIVKESNTEESFNNDDDLIPKNSSLVVSRQPLEKNQKKVWYEEEKVLNNTIAGNDSAKALFKSNIENSSDLTEDDKITQMMSNSSEMYNQKNWLHLRGRSAYQGQRVPPNYKCNRCSLGGHFIYDCPQMRNDMPSVVKKTTGIPRSFLQPATVDTPGAKINPQGNIQHIGVNFLVYYFYDTVEYSKYAASCYAQILKLNNVCGNKSYMNIEADSITCKRRISQNGIFKVTN